MVHGELKALNIAECTKDFLEMSFSDIFGEFLNDNLRRNKNVSFVRKLEMSSRNTTNL